MESQNYEPIAPIDRQNHIDKLRIRTQELVHQCFRQKGLDGHKYPYRINSDDINIILPDDDVLAMNLGIWTVVKLGNFDPIPILFGFGFPGDYQSAAYLLPEKVLKYWDVDLTIDSKPFKKHFNLNREIDKLIPSPNLESFNLNFPKGHKLNNVVFVQRMAPRLINTPNADINTILVSDFRTRFQPFLNPDSPYANIKPGDRIITIYSPHKFNKHNNQNITQNNKFPRLLFSLKQV